MPRKIPSHSWTHKWGREVFVESKLKLDPGLVNACRQAASGIAGQVLDHVGNKTTSSIERTTARLLGVDGVNEQDVPLPNVLVEQVLEGNGLGKGLAYWLGNAMIHTGLAPQAIAEMVRDGALNLLTPPLADGDAIRQVMATVCAEALRQIEKRRSDRERFRARLGENPAPRAYVLTATGNVYEDVVHAHAVAEMGGDIIAVIRSTAQSLLDFVPYGPTTEGFGGTFATQANFRIMREALDEWSEANKRYVQLSSFCSGLCMPEIAAMGAMEGLDNMVNDALYGILYRDINMIRTLTDQKVSRLDELQGR